MKKRGQSDFSKGVCNGLPVALGYIPLAFSFGTIAISGGYNFIVPTIMSMLSFTGAGQMAGIQMMIQAASLVSIFLVNLLVGVLHVTYLDFKFLTNDFLDSYFYFHGYPLLSVKGRVI